MTLPRDVAPAMNLAFADQPLLDALAAAREIEVLFSLERPRLAPDEMRWQVAMLVERAERRSGRQARGVELDAASQSFRLRGHPDLVRLVAGDWGVMDAEVVDASRAPAAPGETRCARFRAAARAPRAPLADSARNSWGRTGASRP